MCAIKIQRDRGKRNAGTRHQVRHNETRKNDPMFLSYIASTTMNNPNDNDPHKMTTRSKQQQQQPRAVPPRSLLQPTKQLSGSIRGLPTEEGGESTSNPKRQRVNNGSSNGSDDSYYKEQQRQLHQALQTSPFGDYKFHGTGNPLYVRSPTVAKTLAVDTLARIIQSGHLGGASTGNDGGKSGTVPAPPPPPPDSDSPPTPHLRTERGFSDSSFWADRFRLAGQYGWTGVILLPDADTSRPLAIANVPWFLVEMPQDKERLHELVVRQGGMSEATWQESLEQKVLTVEAFLQKLMHDTTKKQEEE